MTQKNKTNKNKIKNNVAVLGSGNTGLSFAGDLSLSGFKVTLFDLPRYEESLNAVRDSGGIEMAGVAREGFGELHNITNSIEETLNEAKVLILAVPAYGHAEFARLCAPYLTEGHIIVLGSDYTLQSIMFSNVLLEEGVELDNIIVAETASTPYATRKYLPNKIFCSKVKTKIPFSTFPADKSDEALETLFDIYIQEDKERGILTPVENILATSLSNIGPPNHVSRMLLNAIHIEKVADPDASTDGSSAFERLRDALSKEFVTLQRSLGLKARSYKYILNSLMYPPGSPIHSRSASDVPKWVNPTNQPGSYSSENKLRLSDMRYLAEDVPYALIGASFLGDILGVPVPVIDSCIKLSSEIMGTDFCKQRKIFEQSGISNFDKEELLKYVNKGTT